MNEEWKAVPSLDYQYEVSNTGRVRSITRDIEFTRCGKKQVRHFEGKELSPVVESGGYLGVMVNISHPQKLKFVFIHRLVAEVFIPNPSNLKYVSRLDGDPSNNNVDNLFWADKKDAFRPRDIRPVMDVTSGEIYPSASAAGQALGIDQVLRSIKGNQTCRGHKFIFVEDNK